MHRKAEQCTPPQSAVVRDRLLITGFSPFSNNRKNVSQEVLSRISESSVYGIEVETQLLTVDEIGSSIIANRILDGARFSGIIHLGLAVKREKINLERFASNLISMKEPDNSGRLLDSEQVVIGAPSSLETTAPIHILDEEFEHDELVYWSNDAGTFVCNETYFRTLNALNQIGLSNTPVVFIHLPPEGKIPVEKQVDKVIQIASTIVTRPTYDVVAGLLFDNKGRILACKRPAQDAWAGWWEFPGGKMDQGETASDALVRELKEEIGITANPRKLIESTTFEYDDRTVKLQIWNCGIVDEKEIILNEHDESRWLSRDELMDVKWLPADLPIISRWSLEGIPN